MSTANGKKKTKKRYIKLKNDFIIQSVCDIPMAVSQEFGGVIRLNNVSRFIFESLREETTEITLLDELCNRYDAPRETIECDLRNILAQLREAELLEE